MNTKKLALLFLILLALAVLALLFFKTKVVPPKIELVSVSKGNITTVDDKVLLIVEHGDRFNITFKTSPKYAGARIACFCDTVNFTQDHPFKGKECGGYGLVDENGYCVTEGWVADAPPGWVFGFKCYLLEEGEKLERSEFELYIKVKELPPAKIELVNVSTGKITMVDNKILLLFEYGDRFNMTFKTSPKYAGKKIRIFCDTINFTQDHPYKGQECGGYGVVDEKGYCMLGEWIANAPPGWVFGFKLYLTDGEEKIKGSELELYFKVSKMPPVELKLVNVSNGRLVEISGKTVIEVVVETEFNITFKTSPKFAGTTVGCLCDTVNFTQDHPYKGKQCGGYGFVDENGYCVTRWYADAPPEWVFGFKCYIFDWRGEIKDSELEIYIKVVEAP